MNFLTLSDQAIEVIFQGLGELKLKDAGPVFTAIQQQVLLSHAMPQPVSEPAPVQPTAEAETAEAGAGKFTHAEDCTCEFCSSGTAFARS